MSAALAVAQGPCTVCVAGTPFASLTQALRNLTVEVLETLKCSKVFSSVQAFSFDSAPICLWVLWLQALRNLTLEGTLRCCGGRISKLGILSSTDGV